MRERERERERERGEMYMHINPIASLFLPLTECFFQTRL